MFSLTARTMIVAASAAFAAPAFAQDALPPELGPASTAIEAATAAGLVETLAAGGPYTAFIPSNEALASVQDAATELQADQAALAAVIQSHVIEGAVPAADAMALVTSGGGEATVDSLAGTPITLAMEGDTLTVNGSPVTTPDITVGNVTVHVIDGAIPPRS